ncbi:MAG: CehA/McbA family metallohydrolase, partial [Deltaproteobacteria bacterium]|nr:CehA/McbA family metallohydrolase [Deltaproteobacteria bacterium]
MSWHYVSCVGWLLACSSSSEPRDPSAGSTALPPAPTDIAAPALPAPDAEVAPVADREFWLRGSTHVHAKASGDSKTPIPDVIAWYEAHGYDFIAITDHNQVSELDTAIDTTGKPWLRDPSRGLIVLSGIELTQNANGCLPAGDASGKCRIHVNLIGTTARPRAKLKGWLDNTEKQRLVLYGNALAAAKPLGGIAQLNHPQWFWGMNPDLLVELAKRGVVLYEVWNRAFAKWNVGDSTHPSTEALWDAALARGATLWGVAADDAHHYDGGGKYPAGGAWVMVKARRDPQAIVDALAAGRFYASTGVSLARAETERGELVVEIAQSDA